MRLCPSVDGSGSPLITHRIGVDVCLARQGTFFHKCHRCIYRGQAASWEPAPEQLAMPPLPVAGDTDLAAVKVVTIPVPARLSGKAGKADKSGKNDGRSMPAAS